MKKTTKFSIYFFAVLILLNIGWWGNEYYKSKLKITPDPISYIKHRPLDKYQIENLSTTEVPAVNLNIQNNLFDFTFDPSFSGKKEKKVTGLINIPDKEGLFPIVILLRGYVDQSIYTSGTGTKRVGEYFVENGYITLAPDFLGYGGSDPEAQNIFEARFQTYTTILTLLESIKKNPLPKWDKKNIFIWGHSNGGQVALTVLEIAQVNYPTVLWAPVTENFPYSILFYTNESEDKGKFIRRELSKFESEYDVDKFSLTNYLDRIKAPIEYHYGTNDDAIPVEWRDRFVKQMTNLKKDFKNYNHPGADHNMNPLWGEIVKETFNFFEKNRI